MTIQEPLQTNSGTGDKAAPRSRAANSSARPGAVELPLLIALVLAVLFYAWLQRNSGDITAESGLGYALGIVGGSMMALLLIYPLRKRARALRFLGNIRGWFRIHMILGLVGPTAIIVHSNFTFGSLNSTAALTSMLVVAGSGIIGRFLYARIHRGLYGRKETLRQRIAEIEQVHAKLRFNLDISVEDMLVAYQTRRLDGVMTFWTSFANTMTGPFSRQRLRRKLIRRIELMNGSADAADFSDALQGYLAVLGRAEAFRFYERMFAAWHFLHLPLFLILVFAAVTHVLAVHLY